MTATVRPMPMKVDEDTVKNLYRVDIELVCSIGGYRLKTFGVYESQEVARFVAEQIRNGHITVN